MVHVLLDQAQADAVERLGGGGDLGEHVDAVLVLLDHPLDPADLALDAAKAAEVVVSAHGVATGDHHGTSLVGVRS